MMADGSWLMAHGRWSMVIICHMPSAMSDEPFAISDGRGGAESSHLRPPRPRVLWRAVQRPVDHEVGHPLHDHIEVERRDAVALEVRRRVQEVDRVGNAVLDRE